MHKFRQKCAFLHVHHKDSWFYSTTTLCAPTKRVPFEIRVCPCRYDSTTQSTTPSGGFCQFQLGFMGTQQHHRHLKPKGLFHPKQQENMKLRSSGTSSRNENMRHFSSVGFASSDRRSFRDFFLQKNWRHGGVYTSCFGGGPNTKTKSDRVISRARACTSLRT